MPVLRRWPRGLLKYGGEALHLRGAGDWRRGQWDAAGRGEGKSLDWRPRRSGAQLSETRHLPRPRARATGAGIRRRAFKRLYRGGRQQAGQGQTQGGRQIDAKEGRKTRWLGEAGQPTRQHGGTESLGCNYARAVLFLQPKLPGWRFRRGGAAGRRRGGHGPRLIGAAAFRIRRNPGPRQEE